MSHFLFIVIAIIAILGLGMIKEHFREKMIRTWVAEQGGILHWPFVEAQHKDLPAKQLTCRFETQGAHQWAAGIEHEAHGKAVWLIEYSATPAGHSTGRWHCLVAERCTHADEAQRLCRDRSMATSHEWVCAGDWVAIRHIGLISSTLLAELSARIR